jgi:hypothetical protein
VPWVCVPPGIRPCLRLVAGIIQAVKGVCYPCGGRKAPSSLVLIGLGGRVRPRTGSESRGARCRPILRGKGLRADPTNTPARLPRAWYPRCPHSPRSCAVSPRDLRQKKRRGLSSEPPAWRRTRQTVTCSEGKEAHSPCQAQKTARHVAPGSTISPDPLSSILFFGTSFCVLTGLSQTGIPADTLTTSVRKRPRDCPSQTIFRYTHYLLVYPLTGR